MKVSTLKKIAREINEGKLSFKLIAIENYVTLADIQEIQELDLPEIYIRKK